MPQKELVKHKTHLMQVICYEGDMLEIQKPRNGVEVNVTIKMPKMLCITPPSQEEPTHQIWDSYLK